MSSPWEAAINHVLWYETGGDLVNGALHLDPDDPGGLTKWGISQRAFPHLVIKDLNKKDAEDIYYEKYWTGPKIDQLPPRIAIQVFDHGVTAGPTRAIKILQSSVGLKADGIIGLKTKEACEWVDAARVFVIDRLDFYRRLNKPKYIDGWINRAAACALVAGKF